MVIAEKAGSTFSPFWGNIFRKFTSGAVVFTLYGSCVLLLVLMSSFLENIFNFWEVDINKKKDAASIESEDDSTRGKFPENVSPKWAEGGPSLFSNHHVRIPAIFSIFWESLLYHYPAKPKPGPNKH